MLTTTPRAAALVRAAKLQRRAARVGFDWPEPVQVVDKIEEEIAEVRAELGRSASLERLSDEIGDLLFALVNLARHLEVDAEASLRQANAKFERRFGAIEDARCAPAAPFRRRFARRDGGAVAAGESRGAGVDHEMAPPRGESRP